MKFDFRYPIMGFFVLLTAVSLYFSLQIGFSFDFEQFFPQGDPDLEFFQEFTENFESDDNFLLVAVENKPDVFDSAFLAKFHELTLRADTLPFVTGTQSITTLQYPVISPLFTMQVPAIHMDEPARYSEDKEDLLQDKMLVNNLITKDGTALILFIKNENELMQPDAVVFMDALENMVKEYEFEDYHFLGRANFMKELVDMQKRELIVSIIISSILTAIIIALLFQRSAGVMIALASIGMSLALFGGAMYLMGRQLTALSALYPVLMSIVATSDAVHFMTKYVDELRKGKLKSEAIRITIKEIGLATLLTSVTTAVGFASLMTSKIPAIREFGMNASVGVMVAYITVLFFTTSALSYFKADQIIKQGRGQAFWEKWMLWFYNYTKLNPRQIAIGASLLAITCLIGISLITTNYRLEENLPIGKKVTYDYKYFENNLAGFRPLEVAILTQNDYDTDDYKVVKAINQIEEKLESYAEIQNVNSITALYKGLNRAHNGNQIEAYEFPSSKGKFVKYQRFAKKVPSQSLNVLVSEDKKIARITSRVKDIGADNVREISEGLQEFIDENIDTSVIKTRQTGTSLMLDKNAQYIRTSLLTGLGIAILIVSILMALIYQNWKMVIIALIPNVFPLLLAGALLGYFNIELEGGVAIIFAVIFGIAVDDTIHFLSKFRLARAKGMSIDDAMKITFTETGKAICLTTVILFFGFLVLLFSIHPPSVVVGGLIAITLISALFSDLFVIPVLIRWLM